jgi:rhodanese-related sulfurtransferase
MCRRHQHPARQDHRLAHGAYPAGTLFVVYCSGLHCNGAQRGTIRLAQLGLAVKLMIGGMSG